MYFNHFHYVCRNSETPSLNIIYIRWYHHIELETKTYLGEAFIYGCQEKAAGWTKQKIALLPI